MSSFDIAYVNTEKNEGGYVNNPKDSGGETYAGIARNFNPSWAGWAFIDEKKKAGPIKRNTKFPELAANVKAFYKANYWDNKGFGSINSQSLANIIHDTYVTSGSYLGWITKKAFNPALEGIISKSIPFNSDTISQINAVNQPKLFEDFKAARAEYFKRIATGDNAGFLTGWLNRLDTFSFTDVSALVKKNYKWLVLGVFMIVFALFIFYYKVYEVKAS